MSNVGPVVFAEYVGSIVIGNTRAGSFNQPRSGTTAKPVAAVLTVPARTTANRALTHMGWVPFPNPPRPTTGARRTRPTSPPSLPVNATPPSAWAAAVIPFAVIVDTTADEPPTAFDNNNAVIPARVLTIQDCSNPFGRASTCTSTPGSTFG